MRGLIITGTDTGIGKTVLAAGIAAHLASTRGAARYWKPVQAGLDDETDSQTIARLAPNSELVGDFPTLAPGGIRQISPLSVAFRR